MKRYGLIGQPLTHSFSQKYFTQKFEREHITGCRYDLFPLGSIDELGPVLQTPGLQGLNVTIPYKEQVIRYLDRLDPVVAAIGACNCIRIVNGQLMGFNTDVTGFRESLLAGFRFPHNGALVLGTGGASKAVVYVLQELGLKVTTVSRTPAAGMFGYADLSEDLMRSNTLIVNTTPLGTTPDILTLPPIPYRFLDSTHYLFDLVYNPGKTSFLKQGEERGATIRNGQDMLEIQAEESWKIWNGRDQE